MSPPPSSPGSPTPVSTGESIITIASIAKATPTEVYAPTLPTSRGETTHRITKILVANIDTIAGATTVQVFFGVRYHLNGGGASWTAMAAPVLDVGESASYDVNIELGPSDDLVSYADNANVSSITFFAETGQ